MLKYRELKREEKLESESWALFLCKNKRQNTGKHTEKPVNTVAIAKGVSLEVDTNEVKATKENLKYDCTQILRIEL